MLLQWRVLRLSINLHRSVKPIVFKEALFYCPISSFGTSAEQRTKLEAPVRVVKGDWFSLPTIVRSWVQSQARTFFQKILL